MSSEEELVQVCKKFKSKLKDKVSVFMGRKVLYFKGKSLQVQIYKNPQIYKAFSNKTEINEFLQELLKKNLIKRVEPQYRGTTKNLASLLQTRDQKIDEESLYIWNPKVSESLWQKPLLALLILAVLGACCFPVWPIWAKLGVWYCSVTLLCVIIGVSIVRYIVFFTFFIFGIEFWIFPNLYDDRAGFWETLTPVYFIRKREEYSGCNIFFRLVVLFSFIGIFIYFYLNPSALLDIWEVSYGGVSELVIWGEDKIYNNSTELVDPNSIKYSYENIMRDEDILPDL